MGSNVPRIEFGPPVVYVVDDDRDFRVSVVTLLSAGGVQVRPFAESHDLLREIDELPPGFILLDIRMPCIGGIDLLAMLRERDCHWPVAIMTAHGEIPLAVQAMRLGAIDFLEKPFTVEALDEVLRVAFEKLPDTVVKSQHRKAGHRIFSSLSPRQKQVFTGVIEGLTSKEMAIRYGISYRTVQSYRIDMMNKLGAKNLVDLLEINYAMHGMNARN
ncbi:response regulator [Novosphingobium sp. G106]|uniref:response regulator transcription factor n=1 Tax=Novosphingobium sp. G106 TaxID=2849500 RepID=UPI001C2DCBCB|nr:response regulator [Novosphingobium sp. G106]MBV1692322.1 response regulator [Novosphingobium sp. G106]